MSQQFTKLAIALVPCVTEVVIVSAMQAQPPTLATLSDGNYQICTQPPPKDWQQGEGVCLVFRKQNQQIEGYYGYPHSDGFVCLRGLLNDGQIIGQAYLVSWEGSQWRNPPNKAFFWDEEQQLQLAQGKVIEQNRQAESHRILFQKATLNFQSFYLYPKPQMTSSQQLCDWSFARS
ncbi:hypothetical protein ACQ4M3_24025 [Leptolyngbya sp. AN03gr2]